MNEEHGIFEAKDLKYRKPYNEELSSNKSILGVLEGTHFCPNSFSRNKRFYPEELWKKCIASESVQRRMRDKNLFGCIGHSEKLTEKEISEGKCSHFTVDLEIRDPDVIEEVGEGRIKKNGYGKSYILDTVTGRVLNTLSEAGCRLYMSTRADGAFKGQFQGQPVMDEDNYFLDRIDVVINPGFLECNPKLKKNLKSEEIQLITEAYEPYKEFIEKSENKESEINMERSNKIDKIIEAVDSKDVMKVGYKDILKLQTEMYKSNDYSTDLKKNLEKFDDIRIDKWYEVFNKLLDKGVDVKKEVSEKAMEELLDANKALESQNIEMKSRLEEYEKLGDLPEITKLIEDIKEYKEFIGRNGDIESIVETLNMSKKHFEENGSSEKIKETLEKTKVFFSEVGEPEKIKDILKTTEEFFEKYGSMEEIKEAHEATIKNGEKIKENLNKLEALESFEKEVGSFESVKNIIEKSVKFFEEYGSIEEISSVYGGFKSFSEKYGTVKEIEKKLKGYEELVKENKALELSNKIGINKEKIIEKIAQGLSEKDIVEFYSSRVMNQSNDPYVVKSEILESKKKKNDKTYIKNESVSRISRVLGVGSE